MLTPAFAPFNQFISSPPIYSSPPQIFYWTGYGPPSGPISPTYIQPLPIPPHAFHHFHSPERPPTLVRINLFYSLHVSTLTSHIILTNKKVSHMVVVSYQNSPHSYFHTFNFYWKKDFFLILDIQ